MSSFREHQEELVGFHGEQSLQRTLSDAQLHAATAPFPEHHIGPFNPQTYPSMAPSDQSRCTHEHYQDLHLDHELHDVVSFQHQPEIPTGQQPVHEQIFDGQIFDGQPHHEQQHMYKNAQSNNISVDMQIGTAVQSDVAENHSAQSTSEQPPLPSDAPEPASETPTCPKCQVQFSSNGTLKKHDDTVHLGKETYVCDYPGCRRSCKPFNREWSYRRHMLEIHGVEIKAPTQKAAAPPTGNAGQDKDDMRSYLQGAGAKLPTDIKRRKMNKTTAQETVAEHDTQDVHALRTEVAELRDLVRKLKEELRLSRARHNSQLQEMADKHRAEMDEAMEGYVEKLERLGHEIGVRDEFKAEMAQLKERHEKELCVLRDRHEKNERRLWNLLKE